MDGAYCERSSQAGINTAAKRHGKSIGAGDVGGDPTDDRDAHSAPKLE